MTYTIESITNIFYRTEDKSIINCLVKFAEFKDAYPFSASASDIEEHGLTIYQDIVSGKYGPIGDYVPPTPLTTDQLWSKVRNQRNALLSASDYTQMPDFNPSTKAVWSSYRQELRDIPQKQTDPSNIIWPISPSQN
jgi:hypothetical protein